MVIVTINYSTECDTQHHSRIVIAIIITIIIYYENI